MCTRQAVNASISKKVKSIQLANYNSLKLIDAGKAVWVVGGSKAAVMSSIAKWAFSDKKGAEAFGGKIPDFKAAGKAAVE